MDMGQDATGGSMVARDAVAYTIDYFNNDYKPITTNAVQHVTPVSLNLYNGNIARQTVAIDTFQRLNKQYIYDQLNRIHSAAYASVNPVNGTLTGLTDFHNNYSYDADGNLQTLVRYGNNTGSGALVMDSLSYLYSSPMPNNQLWQIIENAPNNYPAAADIKPVTGPPMPQYQYDAIGNTTQDMVSGQNTIEWNLYNKVDYARNNADNSTMEFTYDGAGNRVEKSYLKHSGDTDYIRNDYYVHDAQGNILAIYHEKSAIQTGGVLWQLYDDFSLAEHDIYGSSRLGVKDYYDEQVGFSIDAYYDYTDTQRLWNQVPWYSLEYQDVIKADSTNLYGNTFTDSCYAQQTIGQKQYELTDHLGDVLATVSDKRATDSLKGIHTTGSIDTVESFKPVVVSATDYYPFGMQMPGRYMVDTATHTFNITMMEPVPQFHNQYYAFNAIPGFFSMAPTGSAYLTSTALDLVLNTTSAPGDGLTMTIDSLAPGLSQTIYLVLDGGSTTYVASIPGISSWGIFTPTLAINITPTTSTVTLNINQYFSGGFLTHYLNLRGIYVPRYDSTITENVVSSVSNEDHYHYGYNGKMKDNEWAGIGNHVDFGDRALDTRTGRWQTPDKMANKSPGESSYCYAGNSPIIFVDVKGDFKFSKETISLFQTKYPTAYKYLVAFDPSSTGNITEVVKNDRVINAMISNTMFANPNHDKSFDEDVDWSQPKMQLTKQEVQKAFSNGNGPEIMFRNDPGGFAGNPYEGMGAAGHNSSNEGTNYSAPMELNTALLDKLEGSKTNLEKKVALTNLVSDVIHEYMEYFGQDNVNTFDKSGKQIGTIGAVPAQSQIFGGHVPSPGNGGAMGAIKDNQNGKDDCFVPNLPPDKKEEK